MRLKRATLQLTFAFGVALLSSAPTAANERNDLPSCYAHYKLAPPAQNQVKRDLVIVVDKTVVFPKDIVSSAIQTAQRFIRQGDRISVYSFSAFVPGQYMDMEWAGVLESAPGKGEQDNYPVLKLKGLEHCLNEQLQFAGKSVSKALEQIAASSSNDIPKSEIIFSLKKLGAGMQAKNMQKPRILLVSDMLENSDYFTFYAGNSVAVSNPEKALANMSSQGLFANLQGAEVYVTGAGILTPGIATTYRSGALIDKLESFWRSYFKSSKAELKAFGAPKLLSDIR